MHAIHRDLIHAGRTLGRTPGFTIAALAALALGIAVNTAMFSVINAVLVKPLPYPEPDRIVMFQNTYQGRRIGSAAPVEFNWWRQQTSWFDDVSAYAFDVANLTGGSAPEQIPLLQVSARFFRLWGAVPLHGRTFTVADDTPGTAKTVVLAFGFWQRRFGGDPGVIGTRIMLNGESHEVIGVMRPELAKGHLAEQARLSGDIAIGAIPDVYVPFQLDPNSTDSGHFFNVAGRLRPDVSVAVAEERLRASYTEYRRTRPDISPEAGFGLQPLQEAIVGGVRQSLIVLFAAVGLVLLIACANVANLLLARATARNDEMAIRAALGATRAQIVRQLLIESLVLSLAGAAAGLAVGYLGALAILRVGPGLPRIGAAGANVDLDWRVLAFTVAVSTGAAVLCGLMPALHASRAGVAAGLNGGAQRGAGAARHNRTRSLLVIGEIALAVVLMIGAALLMRTLYQMQRVNSGFTARNVLTVRMLPTGPRFAGPRTSAAVVREGLQRLRALAGVEAAAITCCLPLEDRFYTRILRPGGPDFGEIAGSVDVSDGYFETFRIPMLLGRTFTDGDDPGSPVAIINDTLARQFAPDDPLESFITVGTERWRIIGVVADVRDDALNREARPIVYHRAAPASVSAGGGPLVWVIRTSGPPARWNTAMQEVLRDVTGGLPTAVPRAMDDVIAQSTAAARFNALVLMIFAGSALLLAAIGIYGVAAYAVTQRMPELGVRMALGADGRRIRRMILREDLRLALTGVGCGVALALALTRLLATLLFRVEPWDPQAFVLVPVILLAVALVAAWWPAVRASRVDPMIALRIS